MRKLVISALVGLLFSVGLALSGMTQPSKIIGFLDFLGDWDPTLLFVMAGAILVHLPLYRLVKKRKSPILSAKFLIPDRRDIDKKLIAGAAIFGMGWGLAGFCPGPAIVAAGAGLAEALIFVAAMVAGFAIFQTGARFLGAATPKSD